MLLGTLVLVVISSVGLATAAGASQMDAQLVTDADATIGGRVQLTAAGGIHVEDVGGEDEITLEASTLTIETEWERGKLVEGPADTQYRHVEDSGKLTRTFEQVELSVGTWKQGTELLIEPATEASVDAQSLGASRIQAVASKTLLAWGGYSEQDQSAGGNVTPSYSYRTRAPLVSIDGLDSIQARGSLEAFANNATLEMAGQENSWSDWTGFRILETTGPSREYEIRISVLHLEQARLFLNASQKATVLSSALATSLDGTLELDDAHGLVSTAGGKLRLDGETTQLTGKGLVNVSIGEPDASWSEDPVVESNVQGDFEMLAPSGSIAASPGTTNGPALSWSSALLIAIGALALIALFALALGLRLSSRWLAYLPPGVRDRLHARYDQRAGRHLDAGRRRAAARCYETMSALCPTHPTAWYGAAINRLEAGEPARAAELMRTARQRLPDAPLELLEVEIAASAEDGDTEGARRTLIALAEAAPAVARRLVVELDLQELARDQAVASALRDPERGWPSA